MYSPHTPTCTSHTHIHRTTPQPPKHTTHASDSRHTHLSPPQTPTHTPYPYTTRRPPTHTTTHTTYPTHPTYTMHPTDTHTPETILSPPRRTSPGQPAWISSPARGKHLQSSSVPPDGATSLRETVFCKNPWPPANDGEMRTLCHFLHGSPGPGGPEDGSHGRADYRLP